MSYHLQAALACERHKTLLAEAEAFRRAKQARNHQPTAPQHRPSDTALAAPVGAGAPRSAVDEDAGMSTRLASRRTVAHTGRPFSHRSRLAGERAMLRDGSDVLIRPVRHDDAVLLADGFDRLSAQSRRFRFLTAKNYLSPSEVRYLTDIDHHDHEALGALAPVNGRGLGVARYVRAAAGSAPSC